MESNAEKDKIFIRGLILKSQFSPRLCVKIMFSGLFYFPSIASRVWLAETVIGVPGPKIFAAPAA